MKNYILLLVIGIMAILPLEASQSYGTVQGKVSEEQGNRSITGVLVKLMDTELTTLSNEDGEYKLLQVPVGNYRIKFSYTGFETIIKTDIIVRPNRITFLDVKMREDLPWLNETVTVEESYFHKDIEIPNINHLPRLASSGGVFSAFNPDLFQNVEFYSSAFSADYKRCIMTGARK